jgi:hypothetical protein
MKNSLDFTTISGSFPNNMENFLFNCRVYVYFRDDAKYAPQLPEINENNKKPPTA